MSLQGLKRRKMLCRPHTGSDLLVKGGHLLMKATDPKHHPVLVNDERQLGAYVFNDLALQLLKY